MDQPAGYRRTSESSRTAVGPEGDAELLDCEEQVKNVGQPADVFVEIATQQEVGAVFPQEICVIGLGYIGLPKLYPMVS